MIRAQTTQPEYGGIGGIFSDALSTVYTTAKDRYVMENLPERYAVPGEPAVIVDNALNESELSELHEKNQRRLLLIGGALVAATLVGVAILTR